MFDDLNVMNAIGRSSLKNYTVILTVSLPSFRGKGFEILQNINDRLTLVKEIKHAKDPIFLPP
jgi:hypothetical protein